MDTGNPMLGLTAGGGRKLAGDGCGGFIYCGGAVYRNGTVYCGDAIYHIRRAAGSPASARPALWK